MKNLVFAATLVALSFLAGPVQAQTTGPSLLKKLLVQIKAEPLFEVTTSNDHMVITDRSTGEEVFSLREINAQTVTLTGRVGTVGKSTPEFRQQVQTHIMRFNISSNVGTLYLDDATGEVTMKHHLNPRLVTVSAMAQTANLFGQVARSQSQILHQ